MLLSHKIKEIRKEKGISQQKIASELQMSQRAYSHLETGKTKIDIERLLQVAAFFEMDPAELLKASGEIINHNKFEDQSNGYFANKMKIADSAEAKQAYVQHIQSLEKEIAHLKSLIDQLIAKR